MNKVIDKAKTVINDRKKVKQMIINNMYENLQNLINNIEDMIEHNDIDIKKKTSLIKSKNIINKLVEEMLILKDIDDIKVIRRKLNYHINKIKNELENRNIKTNEYTKNVNLFRNDITEYTRCIKREDNIDYISSYDYLHMTKESKKEINNFINKEKDFNKRVNDRYNASKTIETNNKVIPIKNELVITPIKSVSEIDTNSIKEDNAAIKKAVMNNRMIRLISTYKLVKTSPYNGNFILKCKNLITNLPRYIHNNKKVKQMKNDYLTYYSGKDLFNLISMVKHSNSFKEAMGEIFRKNGKNSNFDVCTRKISELFDIMEEKNNVSSEDFDYIPLKQKVLTR